MWKILVQAFFVMLVVTEQPVWAHESDWTAQMQETTPTDSKPSGIVVRELTDAQNCMIRICDRPPTNRLISVALKSWANLIDKNFSMKYGPYLKEVNLAFQAELDDRKRELENAIKMARENVKIDLKFPLVMNKRFEELKAMAPLMSKMTLTKAGNLDELMFYDLLRSQEVSSDLAQKTILNTKRLIQLQKSKPEILNGDYAFYVQSHPPAKIKSDLQKIIAGIEKKRAAVVKESGISAGVLYNDKDDWRRLKAKINAGEFSEHDIENLDKYYEGSFIWQPILLEGVSSESLPKPRYAKDLINGAELKKLEDELAEIQAYKGVDSFPPSKLVERKNTILSHCRLAVTMVDSYFPDPKQAHDLIQNEKKWREEFVGKVSGVISTESSAKVKKYFAQLKMKGAKTKSDWLKEKTEDMVETSQEDQRDDVTLNKVTQQMSFIGVLREDKDDLIGSDVDQICTDDGKYPSPWDDNARLSSAKLHLGALSATDPIEGRSTAFHEYGHILDGFMIEKNGLSPKSLGWISAMKSCVQKPYGKEEKYITEDFADALSASFANDAGNFYCGFLSMNDMETFSLINADTSDTHSSHLYRALHRRLYTGGVPEVCAKALTAKGQKFELNKCL